MSATDWDPDADVNPAPPSKATLQRIRRDLLQLAAEPLHGVVLLPDPGGAALLFHALISGPVDTPYEGCFLYFRMRLPPDYPSCPPKVKLCSTGGGRVRIHPNLYASGKVCLSILGTWQGPAWSPANSLSSVLMSIQSLLTDAPLRSEPGFEAAAPAAVAAYSHIAAWNALRACALDNIRDALAGSSRAAMPPDLASAVLSSAGALGGETYSSIFSRYAPCEGTAYSDPLTGEKGLFQFTQLRDKLLEAVTAAEERAAAEGEGEEGEEEAHDGTAAAAAAADDSAGATAAAATAT